MYPSRTGAEQIIRPNFPTEATMSSTEATMTTRKSLVFNILVSKFLVLKILRAFQPESSPLTPVKALI